PVDQRPEARDGRQPALQPQHRADRGPATAALYVQPARRIRAGPPRVVPGRSVLPARLPRARGGRVRTRRVAVVRVPRRRRDHPGLLAGPLTLPCPTPRRPPWTTSSTRGRFTRPRPGSIAAPATRRAASSPRP